MLSFQGVLVTETRSPCASAGEHDAHGPRDARDLRRVHRRALLGHDRRAPPALRAPRRRRFFTLDIVI